MLDGLEVERMKLVNRRCTAGRGHGDAHGRVTGPDAGRVAGTPRVAGYALESNGTAAGYCSLLAGRENHPEIHGSTRPVRRAGLARCECERDDEDRGARQPPSHPQPPPP